MDGDSPHHTPDPDQSSHARDSPTGDGPPPNDRIRVATLNDLKFVDHVQRKFGHSLGFLPRIAIEQYIEQQAVYLTRENSDDAGYLISRPFLRWQPALRSITQAAVLMDAQRRRHGLTLLATIEAESRAAGLVALQACCAVGLDSNAFWQAAGFKPICYLSPANARNRDVICWRKPLVRSLPFWFAELPRRAGYRAHLAASKRNIDRSADALEFNRRLAEKAQARKAGTRTETT